MEVLSANNLKGIWATPLIPVNANDSIDYVCLESELDFLCHSGISGMYSNGTAGEFFNQTEGEFDRIQVLMAEKCAKNNIPFQIGACHMSPVISLERIGRSRFLNPGAFQVIFPDWLPVTQGEQIVFLKKVAEATASVPIVLYNPGHSKTVLKPTDFKRLSDAIPGLIGIKVAAGNLDWFEAMRSNAHQLSVFIQGHLLATGIKEGVAAGSYSNMACFNPVGAVAWYNLMLEDIAEALMVEKRIADFFENCIFPFARAGYSDPALDKLLAFAGGWSSMSTRIRFPYKWVNEEDALKVRRQAKKMLPEWMTRF